MRTARGMFASITRDLRHASAAVRRAPGFSALAILTIAVATGASTAMFSVVDVLLIRPLPYRDSHRLVALYESSTTLARLGRAMPVNAEHFEHWRRSESSFEDLALLAALDANLGTGGEPQRVTVGRVSPALFRMLGVTPQRGRLLRDEEDRPGADHVVLIGDEFWKREFGADPAIIGRSIRLDGQPYDIAGVLPAAFRFPDLASLSSMTVRSQQPQLWKPFGLTDAERSTFGDFNYLAIGRLRDGVTLAAARTELDRLQSDYARTTLGGRFDLDAEIVPLQQQIASRSQAGIRVAMAAVFAVLLIAYANVANLLLVRAGTRAHEFSIRAALGGSRWHLMRQTLFEALLLSLGGAVLGAGCAVGAVRSVSLLAPRSLPYRDFAVDGRALVFTMVTAIAGGLLTGVWSAYRLARTDARLAAGSARTITASAGITRARALFATTEVALTTACLAVAALLLHSWVTLLAEDKGFTTEHVVAVDLTLPVDRYTEPPARIEFVRSMLAEAQSIQGIRSAAVSNVVPLTGEGVNNAVIADGSVAGPPAPIADIRTVSSAFFDTLGIGLRSGRLFTDLDGQRRVAVVSASTALRIWPGVNPIGQRFRIGAPTAPPIEVVGVVNDVRSASLDKPPTLTVYVPFWQRPVNRTRLSLIVSTDGSPTTIGRAVTTAIHRIDPSVAVPPIRTMNDVVGESVSLRQFQLTLVLAFGAAALLLASGGVYGVLAYMVTQRTREIGVRIALGAAQGRVLWLVVSDAVRVLAVGIAMGLPVALAGASTLRSLLYGVTPTDPLAIAGTCGVVSLVTILAATAPAVRAARVDPLVALRCE